MSQSMNEALSQDTSREDWHLVFASKLLEDNFLLTALEFHAELVEAGKEVSKLKDFFSNPANFEQQSYGYPSVTLPRSSSQATLDSLDLTRFSEDGERAVDEKVAVLEFELRKAKETISALRANLTCAAVTDSSEAALDDKKQHNGIKPHEQRALNFLINEYLLLYGYKLSSITFADENESQDFDDWDDVGLNTARPRELLVLYRDALKGSKIVNGPTCDAQCQTLESDNFDETAHKVMELELEIEKLKENISDLQQEKEKLEQVIILSAQEQSSQLPETSPSPEQDFFELIDDVKSRGSSETKSIQSNSDWTKINNPEPKIEITSLATDDDEERETKPEENLSVDFSVPRLIPERFKNLIFKTCDINFTDTGDILSELVPGELSAITVDNFVEILSDYLQKIIPNIILNKREEIIPLLVLTICLCPNATARDNLLALLFNLKKRPQDAERQQILKALLTIAKVRGPAVTESELLPQCWEQIGHKYMERRLLVAEACFLLAPYVSETIRNSLLLSMIQQLAQDREEIIRNCSVRCLTILVSLISGPDKLTQLCDICFELLADSSNTVSQTVQMALLPALAQWCTSLHRLETELFEKLIKLIAQSPSAALISALDAMLPFLIMYVAGSETVLQTLNESHPTAAKRLEFATLCKGLYDPVVFYSGSVGSVVSAFDHITVNMEDSTDWAELDWILKNMLPRLLKIGEENWDQKPVVEGLAFVIRHLCAGLGKNVTYNLIKPEMSRRLEECSGGLISGQVRNLEMIPLYLIGVLSLGPRDGAGLEQVGGTLLEFLCGVPLCGASILPLQISVECLSRMDALRVVTLDTLWEGVLHQRPVVRASTASLFQSVVPHTPDNLLAARVAPALVTLSNDAELSVKLAVIPTLGSLADAQEKQTRDKVTMTFQTMLLEASHNIPMAVQLSNTLAEHYNRFETQYRNEVILPQLTVLASQCEQNKNSELIKALTEAFSTALFSTNQISPHILANHVIPALKTLNASLHEVNHSERIESLLRHAERLVPSTPSTPPRPIPTDSTALSPSARVEDVKNRVTKIFQNRPQTLQNVSGIFKKKI